MRLLTILAATLAFVAAPAAAREWSDETAKLTFDLPEGWQAQRAPAEGMVYVVANAGEQECHLIQFNRAETADFSAQQIQAASLNPIANDAWSRIPAALPAVFGASASVAGTSVDDDDRAWAVQRADFNAEGRVVHAGIQFRPGLEFWTFCQAKSGPDQPEVFNSVIRSVASVDDAALAEQIRRAERAARARADQNNQVHRGMMAEDNQVVNDQRQADLMRSSD